MFKLPRFMTGEPEPERSNSDPQPDAPPTDDAGSPPEEAPADIEPERRPRVPAKWVAAMLLLLAIAAVIGAHEIVLFIQQGYADGLEYLAILRVALILILTMLVLWTVLREIKAYSRLVSVVELRQAYKRWQERPGPGAARSMRSAFSHYLANARKAGGAKLPTEAAELRRGIASAESPEAWAQQLDQAMLDAMDREVRKIIAREARGVGVATAVSPRGFVDMAIIIWRNVRMIRCIAEAYGVRAGKVGNLLIIRRTVQAVALAPMVEQISGLMPANLLAKFLGAGAEGVVNALMTVRVGMQAQSQCRPLPFEPSAGMFKEVWESVYRQIRGKE